MNNEKRIKKLKENKYQELFGVKKETFDEMLKELNKAYEEEHKKGGRPSVLIVLDKLIVMLEYYREYRTMEHIAFDYDTNKSTICDAIHWSESVLIKSEKFHLPSKKRLKEDTSIEIIAIDATEIETERPKKTKAILLRKKEKAYNKSSDNCRFRNKRHT